MLFQCQQFRSEFVRQSQATILRKVTMTQFMYMIVASAGSIFVLGIPFWLAPVFVVLGYVAGYQHNGELVIRRVIAYTNVWLRLLFNKPRIVSIQSEWDEARQEASVGTLVFRAAVTVEGADGDIVY